MIIFCFCKKFWEDDFVVVFSVMELFVINFL